jgi:hypothetical protein
VTRYDEWVLVWELFAGAWGLSAFVVALAIAGALGRLD